MKNSFTQRVRAAFAQRFKPDGKLRTVPSLLMILCFAGCGGNSTSTTAAPKAAPQNYFAPPVSGTSNGGSDLIVPQLYSIDDTGNAFSQTTYRLQLPAQQGLQTINAGDLMIGQRSLRSLTITANYTYSGANPVYVADTTPKPGGFAVELSGQAGALVQLAGQPAVPVVAATQCPNLKTPQTYQFITIPGALAAQSAGVTPMYGWDPANDTAYGSVDISSSGSTVTFQNIHQYTLPSEGGSGSPTLPVPSSATGTCAATVFGNTITLPYPITIQNPGGGQGVSPSATAGIGPSGLLVEGNSVTQGPFGSAASSTVVPNYNNVLGAGTGTVGLPKPSAALDTNALVGAQYLGFIYSSGIYTAFNQLLASGWSSHLASFGFSAVPPECGTAIGDPTTTPSTLIYGGDFTNDAPATYSGGFGNCDFGIELGPQDPSNNGLYTQATVRVGAGYAGNTTGNAYSFPAVAVAGQLNGKYAIFLVGVDTTQPWAVYLLQSN